MGHSKPLSPHEKFLVAARLASDPLLPEQLYDRAAASPVQGERKLMAAVLLDAVRSFALHVGSPTPQGAKVFREAHEWIFQDDFSWPYSFRNICSFLNVDPKRLRDRLTGVARSGLGSGEQRRLAERLGRVVAEEEDES